MTSPHMKSPDLPKLPKPIFARPPEESLSKRWEELTPEDHVRLDAYITAMLGPLSGR